VTCIAFALALYGAICVCAQPAAARATHAAAHCAGHPEPGADAPPAQHPAPCGHCQAQRAELTPVAAGPAMLLAFASAASAPHVAPNEARATAVSAAPDAVRLPPLSSTLALRL